MTTITWGCYGVDAVRAQREIGKLWDMGCNTHHISISTGIPEARVDRVITDHITRKRFKRPP